MRLLVLVAVLTLTLSGCTGSESSDSTSSQDPSPTSPGPSTTSNGPSPQAPPPTLYLNGTVEGVYDCSNPGLPPVGTNTNDVPPVAWNRTYELTLVSSTGQAPVAGQLCLVFDDPARTMGNTGRVPYGATQVTVAADGVVGGTYSIRID